ncbi:MAG: MmcB family DNA repair protein [Pseudomonadota bacterium]
MNDTADAQTSTDGRQSDRALVTRRGVSRYLSQNGEVCLFELTLVNGRRADILSIAPDGGITIIEVKSSLADLQADHKWNEYLEFCDRFSFATLPDVPLEPFPSTEGLMVADAFGAHPIREPIHRPLHASRRKAITLRVSRQAIGRLQRMEDPNFAIPDV